MPLSITPERLEQCQFASRYTILAKYIGKEVFRAISASGISYTDIEPHDFQTITTLLVPNDIRRKPTCLDIGEYKRRNYKLTVDICPGQGIVHSLKLTKNSPN